MVPSANATNRAGILAGGSSARIVDELEISPEQKWEWPVRGGGRDPTASTIARAARLLENLSKQTGVKFAEAEREVRVLTIKRD
jgi:hypothetical protein